MSKYSDKITINPTVGNTLIALTHDRNLPFDIEVGNELEDGDMQLLITIENEDLELLNKTLCEIINKML